MCDILNLSLGESISDCLITLLFRTMRIPKPKHPGQLIGAMNSSKMTKKMDPMFKHKKRHHKFSHKMHHKISPLTGLTEGSPKDMKEDAKIANRMDNMHKKHHKMHGKKHHKFSHKSHHKAGKKNWIQDAIKKPGALRRSLHVKTGKNIPAGKLAAAAKKSGKMGARARLAETLKGMHHKKAHKFGPSDSPKMAGKQKLGMKRKKMCKKRHKHGSAC